MELLGQGMQVSGEVMIGMTAIMVHRRVWKEHKIDPAVYAEMRREQTVGIFGISLLIFGFLFQVIF